jgi:hypothetical protein
MENTAPHAWIMANYDTGKLRQAAHALRQEMSGVVLDDSTPNAKDQTLQVAVTCLAVAADHIDRMHDDLPPHIINIAVESDGADVFIFGVDTIGRIYILDSNGDWTPYKKVLPDYSETNG